VESKEAQEITLRLRLIEERLAVLEEDNLQLKAAMGSARPEAVDSALRELGMRMKDGRPQNSYFNVRFRHFEAAAADMRVLGSALGGQLGEINLSSRKAGVPERERLKCKLCTQADLESGWAVFWADEMKLRRRYHRKLWEFVYIAQALWAGNKLAAGMHGLGFGCGNEPLPSLFAKYGVSVLATDLDAGDPASTAWTNSAQHARTAEALRKKSICPDENLLQNIVFRPQDMRNIDEDLFGRFDFCWSSCALEHLGSIGKGLDFIRNSLKTLKSGGIAVHTTEFTFDGEPAHEKWSTVLYKEAHLIDLFDRLKQDGYSVAEVDFARGADLLDKFVDLQLKQLSPRQFSSDSHLNTVYDGFVCTSVGMIITAR
jgi:2-polyprenyl-3-methyl-5-hydroxy-6-metoxy-1,4-benzoquinol methylase